MKYTMKQVQATLKKIRKIKPQCNTNYGLSLKETILFMAPVLVEKKEEGVSISQLVEELANDGVVISAPTLSRYLNQYLNCQSANNKSDNYSEAEKPVASGASVEKSENNAANDIVPQSSQSVPNVLLYEAKAHTPNA